jgi:hypothetical protein
MGGAVFRAKYRDLSARSITFLTDRQNRNSYKVRTGHHTANPANGSRYTAVEPVDASMPRHGSQGKENDTGSVKDPFVVGLNLQFDLIHRTAALAKTGGPEASVSTIFPS